MHDPRAVRPPTPTPSVRRRPLVRLTQALALAAIAGAAIGLAGCNARKGEPEAPLDPATYDRVVGLFYAGLGALDSGVQNDLAAAMFTTMTQLAPGEPAGWANLAVARLRSNKDEAAVAALAEALKRAPKSDALLMLDGLIASRSGKSDEAVARWEEAVAIAPTNVRAHFALVQELTRRSDGEAYNLIRTHLDAILAVDPENLKALLDTARAAARAGDGPAVGKALDAFAARTAELTYSVSPDQPDLVTELPALISKLQYADKSDPKALAPQLTMLDNLSRATQAFKSDLAELAAGDQAIGDPIAAFLVLPVPSATSAEADASVTFEARALGDAGAAGAMTSTADATWTAMLTSTAWLRAMAVDLNAPPVPIGPSADGAALLVRTTPPVTLALTVGPVTANGITLFDADNDRRTDVAVAGPKGLQLWRQASPGVFEDVTASLGLSGTVAAGAYGGVWAFDVELDGDLDLLAGPADPVGDRAANVVLQNNGDGTWKAASETGLEGWPIREMAWVDVTDDGVNDVVGIGSQRAKDQSVVFSNLRGGKYATHSSSVIINGIAPKQAGLATGDMDFDGRLEAAMMRFDQVVMLDRPSLGSAEPGSTAPVTTGDWEKQSVGPARAAHALHIGDLDNNGAIDLVVATTSMTGPLSVVWLGQADRTFVALTDSLAVRVTDLADLNADNRIDLLGINAAGQPVVLMNQGGRKAYHAVTLQVKAAEGSDQRINSFGIGGAVEARSGRLTQKVPIDSPFIHIGLGDRTTAELVRFTWPNGTIQPEFDVKTDTPVVVEQRLKGSCPWLYAWDGQRVAFVTDVLWKSPLGLRLNAQDTAGVVTTRDWVKVRGDQLKARVDEGTDGASASGDPSRVDAKPYLDLRVTGELWETHYWDWFGLIAIDHEPEETEVWVDERFVVPPAPLAVQATGSWSPVSAFDEHGNDVSALIDHLDGRYLDTFPLGAYQGLAADHWVELAFDPTTAGGLGASDLANDVLIAQGWLYPTDSSINVALGQGGGPKPQALSLEGEDGQGGWKVIEPFLGFPAGKGKTMLIDLGKLADAPRDANGDIRLRLRTSMEIYWDRIGLARRLPSDGHTFTVMTATLRSATMGYHGFSMTNQYARGVQGPGASPRSQPDTPDYNRIAANVPIWLDLAGWYTRYGPVEPLLAAVDDRYVIVNAGDEVRLRFDDLPPPLPGLVRDYIFQSDGWNKDGDFNTAYSATVHPLPSHDNPMYVAQKVYGAAGALGDDPIHRAHEADWTDYHTRYVSPLPVQRALWRDAGAAVSASRPAAPKE